MAVLRRLHEIQENMERQFSENRKITSGQNEDLNKEIGMTKKQNKTKRNSGAEE